jgi:hypothetical protein
MGKTSPKVNNPIWLKKEKKELDIVIFLLYIIKVFMDKLVDILKTNFGNQTIIDRILSGKLKYSELTQEQDGYLYSEGLFLLREFKVNLSNIYPDSVKYSDVYGVYYSFRDKNKKLHYTRISKDFVVKVGPAADDSVVNGKIVMQKLRRFNDDTLMNTHIYNLLEYVKEYSPPELVFTAETADGRGEARKRLFIGLAAKFPDKVKDVVVHGDEVILYLK